jgi:hypothetical protein
MQLETQIKSIEIKLTEKNPTFTKEEMNSASSSGNTIGGFNKYTGGLTDYLSFGLAAFGFEPSGNLLKFSQMNKLLSRYRFLLMQFGVLLNIFFRTSAIKYDPESSKSELYILEHAKGYYGKFSREKVSLTIFDSKMINSLIYSLAWILKAISFVILRKANKSF